jgi:hypothetical protein
VTKKIRRGKKGKEERKGEEERSRRSIFHHPTRVLIPRFGFNKLITPTHLAMNRSLVQGVLPNCLKGFILSEVYSESEQARGPNP